jgi:hypothetical protein
LVLLVLVACEGGRESLRESEPLEETAESGPVDSRESAVETGIGESGADTEDTEPPPFPICGVTGVPSDGAPWGQMSLLESEVRFEYIGGYFAAGDQDGDGCWDAAFGSSGGGDYPGQTKVFSSPFLGEMDAEADWSAMLEGEPGDWASYPAAGDVDGDGLSDWVVGGDAIDGGQGGAYLVSGPVLGTVDLWAEADAILIGQGDIVNPFPAVNDLDADGFEDVVILAGNYSADGSLPGGAYVENGPVAGMVSLADADAIIVGDWDSDLRGGTSLSSGGDLDGDGLSDVLIGDMSSLGGVGAAYLFRPPLQGTISVLDAEALLYGETWSYAGCDVSAGGDTDGDGYGDLLVGARDYQDMHGRAYLLLGPVSGSHSLGEADAIVQAPGFSAQVGYSVSLEQDLDADGRTEVAVGAPGAEGAPNEGAVFLFYEPFAGTVDGFDEAEAVLYSVEDVDMTSTGYYIDPAGDVNRDGFDDLQVFSEAIDYLVFGGPR